MSAAELQYTSSAAGTILTRERGHFSSKATHMQYPTIRTQHLQIGSGAVEASAKHQVQRRMRCVASRWSDLGHAFLDLRWHVLNERSLDRVV